MQLYFSHLKIHNWTYFCVNRNTLRKTKGNRLAGLNENERQITIGKEGVDFKFEDLDIQVDFIESSLTGTEEDEADISQVDEWLEMVAVWTLST